MVCLHTFAVASELCCLTGLFAMRLYTIYFVMWYDSQALGSHSNCAWNTPPSSTIQVILQMAVDTSSGEVLLAVLCRDCLPLALTGHHCFQQG